MFTVECPTHALTAETGMPGFYVVVAQNCIYNHWLITHLLTYSGFTDNQSVCCLVVFCDYCVALCSGVPLFESSLTWRLQGVSQHFISGCGMTSFQWVHSVCLSACLSLCLPACLSVSLPVGLSFMFPLLSVCLSIAYNTYSFNL